MENLQPTNKDSPTVYWCFNCEKELTTVNTEDGDIYCPACQTPCAEIEPDNDPREFKIYETENNQPTNNNQQQSNSNNQNQQNSNQGQNFNNIFQNIFQNFGQGGNQNGQVYYFSSQQGPGGSFTYSSNFPQNQNNNNGGQNNNNNNNPFANIFQGFGNMNPNQQNNNGQQNGNQTNNNQQQGNQNMNNIFGGMGPLLNNITSGLLMGNHGHQVNMDNPFGSIMDIFGGNFLQNYERLIEEFLRDDPNNYGPPPADKNVIENLKEVPFKPKEAEQEACSVCQDDFKEDEGIIKLPCNHDFHPTCIKNWLTLHNSCPVCRKNITEKKEEGGDPKDVKSEN